MAKAPAVSWGWNQEPVRIRREKTRRATSHRIRGATLSVATAFCGTLGGVSEFDDATQVRADGSTEIHAGWDIGGNANGGYLMALAASGLRSVAGRPDPVSLTAHFLSPGRPGPAVVRGEVVKAGRRFTTVAGNLGAVGADGEIRTVVQVLGTFGDLASEVSDIVAMNGAPPELPPWQECIPRESNGIVSVPMIDHLSVRLHPDHVGWLRGERIGVAEMAGWFGFADGRPLDTLSLLLVADALPRRCSTSTSLLAGFRRWSSPCTCGHYPSQAR